MITYLHLYQKLTFSRMSTPQCYEINVMTFDTECHEICFVGWKTNVMTLMSWHLENVMRFIFSGTGASSLQTHSDMKNSVHDRSLGVEMVSADGIICVHPSFGGIWKVRNLEVPWFLFRIFRSFKFWLISLQHCDFVKYFKLLILQIQLLSCNASNLYLGIFGSGGCW